jgi:hypothetical protein
MSFPCSKSQLLVSKHVENRLVDINSSPWTPDQDLWSNLSQNDQPVMTTTPTDLTRVSSRSTTYTIIHYVESSWHSDKTTFEQHQDQSQQCQQPQSLNKTNNDRPSWTGVKVVTNTKYHKTGCYATKAHKKDTKMTPKVGVVPVKDHLSPRVT